MNIFDKLEKKRKSRGSLALTLIDPDVKNQEKIIEMVKISENSDIDAILVGGSLMMDEKFDLRLKQIKDSTDLPVIIFPGSPNQVSNKADAILYLSLISGRNPQYLIGAHVESAPKIKKLEIETIPTAYILLDGGSKTSVQIISNTDPLPMEKKDIVLAHALAGQYLGNKLLYLEAGSGSVNHVSYDLLSYLNTNIDIPIIVGGGINNLKSVKKLVEAGASYIVFGSYIENHPNIKVLNSFTKAIHYIK